MPPEQSARRNIDKMLEAAGWHIQNYAEHDTDAAIPSLEKGVLWDCQFDAITELEKSLAAAHPRALMNVTAPSTANGGRY